VSRELVIETTWFGALGALLDDGRLIEVGMVDDARPSIRDRIFLGRVRGVDSTLDAAFVDCALDVPAYLSARHARTLTGAARDAPIGRRLHEGQAVLVQGLRDAHGDKGPRVTGDIALPGLFVLLRPRRADVDISAQLARTGDRAGQRARARRLFPEGGVVLRTAAPLAADDELRAEAAFLRRLWQTIEARAAAAKPPVCVYAIDDAIERLLLDMADPRLERLVLGDRAHLARARRRLSEAGAGLARRLEHVPDAWSAAGVREQLEAARDPIVPLAHGGRLIIERTAALTAIDVDGGGRRALDADLDAAREVARQLRLRRIGGTVVVDFIDLPARRDRERLLDALRAALAADPAPVQLHPMSGPGLVALSRRREGADLAGQLARTCPQCAGTGTLSSLCLRSEDLLRGLGTAHRARARIAPDLHRYLEGEGAGARQWFAARHGHAPRVVADASLAPGAFVIEPETGS